MITSLSAITAQQNPNVSGSAVQPAPATSQPSAKAGVTVNLSVSGGVMDAVDDIFNLGQRSSNTREKKLTKEEQDQVFKIVGELLKSGYVGYEMLRVGTRIERHDVDMQIGDSRLRNARPDRKVVQHTSIKV